MSESEHTPGPWRWDGCELWHVGDGYLGSDEVSNPHLYTGIEANRDLVLSSQQIKANMQLIAESPGMKSSLEKVLHFATGSCDMPESTRLSLIARECQAVLAKLQGYQE